MRRVVTMNVSPPPPILSIDSVIELVENKWHATAEQFYSLVEKTMIHSPTILSRASSNAGGWVPFKISCSNNTNEVFPPNERDALIIFDVPMLKEGLVTPRVVS